MTSEDPDEIIECLKILRDTTDGTNFIHESFHKDDSSNYTRSWFAWANGLFGELILKINKNMPHLLEEDLEMSNNIIMK